MYTEKILQNVPCFQLHTAEKVDEYIIYANKRISKGALVFPGSKESDVVLCFDILNEQPCIFLISKSMNVYFIDSKAPKNMFQGTYISGCLKDGIFRIHKLLRAAFSDSSFLYKLDLPFKFDSDEPVCVPNIVPNFVQNFVPKYLINVLIKSSCLYVLKNGNEYKTKEPLKSCANDGKYLVYWEKDQWNIFEKSEQETTCSTKYALLKAKLNTKRLTMDCSDK